MSDPPYDVKTPEGLSGTPAKLLPPPVAHGVGVGVGISSGAGNIRLDFSYAATWLEFTPAQATVLAMALLEHARVAKGMPREPAPSPPSP